MISREKRLLRSYQRNMDSISNLNKSTVMDVFLQEKGLSATAIPAKLESVLSQNQLETVGLAMTNPVKNCASFMNSRRKQKQVLKPWQRDPAGFLSAIADERLERTRQFVRLRGRAVFPDGHGYFGRAS